ncbi:MAG TPA: hypothetical protein ENN19_09060 [Chloroflexi bacterium]|nr:hypothetical protein [Chloroflexota bacterium]
MLVWQNLDEQLQMVRVDGDGRVIHDEVLAVETSKPRDPQLEVGADGRLHLLWREGEPPDAALYYALLSEDGVPLIPPRAISETSIEEYPRLVAGADGRYHAVWADGRGIQWATLSEDGALLSGPTLAVAGAGIPAVQVDEQGNLHLAWRQALRIRAWEIKYAVLNPVDGSVRGLVEVKQLIQRPGQGLDDPIIGLDGEKVYVLWTTYDFKYGGSWSEYAVFPLDAPEQVALEALNLRAGANPMDVYAVSNAGGPLRLAMSRSVPDVEIAGVSRSQVAVLDVGSGYAEEIVTASLSASLLPVLALDEAGQHHLAWLETAEFGRYQVVYASTAPDVVKHYNAWTLADIVDTVFSYLFKASTLIIALVAALLVWAVVPLLVLVLYHVFTSEETLYSWRSYVALFVVLALEVLLTFAAPPRLIVEASSPLVRWGTPAAGALAAALATWRWMKDRERPHLFGVYFLFTGVSSILQVLIYFLM